MSLLKYIKKMKLREKEMRVLFLGLDNAGKSSVIKALLHESIDELSPTVGFQIRTFDVKDYRINCWDVGGQTTIRAYWRNYFEKTDGIVWVVDSMDAERMEECKKELEVVLQEQRLASSSLLIFANKQDIPGALKAKDISKALGLDRINWMHWSIFPCSAATRQGVEDGFKWLVSDIASRLFSHPSA